MIVLLGLAGWLLVLQKEGLCMLHLLELDSVSLHHLVLHCLGCQLLWPETGQVQADADAACGIIAAICAGITPVRPQGPQPPAALWGRSGSQAQGHSRCLHTGALQQALR